MKKLIVLFAFILQCVMTISSSAQAPQGIPYQAVARDSIGNTLNNHLISIRFNIHDSSSSGTIVYQETQNITTTSLGLFSVNIGQGIPISGSLTLVNWQLGSKYLQTEMDVNGGTNFVDMGTTQLMSVPYALSSGDNQWTKNGTSISNNNTGNIGIGISNPSAKLDIIGKIKISDSTQGAGKVLRSDATGLAKWDSIKASDLLNTPLSLILSCPNEIGTVTTNNTSFSVTISGNYAYVVCINSNTMQIINISNPTSPIVVGSVATGTSPVSVAVSGNYAYIVNNGSNTMQVINISVPTSPSVVGSVATGNSPRSVAVLGSYAYIVNNGSNTMQVINISVPTSPSIVGSVATGVNPYSIVVSSNYAYVGHVISNNLKVIDISVPTSPSVVASVTTGAAPVSVTLSGNYVYVLNTNSTMQVIDVSSPLSPIVMGTVSTDNFPQSISVSGNYAYALNLYSMQVFNISTPSLPVNVNSTPIVGSVGMWGVLYGDYYYSVFNNSTLKVYSIQCNIDYDITYNPLNGQTSALPHLVQWNSNGNNIRNANSGNVGISGNLEIGGKVGIGSNSSPQDLLNVGEFTSDATQVGIRSYGNTPSGWKGSAAFGYTSGSVIMGELNGVPTIGGHNANLSAWHKFSINPGGGNVGIGNPNPLAKLDILGNIKIADGTQGYGKVLMSDSNGLASWQTTSSLVGPQGPAGFLLNGSTEGNTPYWNGTSWVTNSSNLFNDGTNIGIGTSTPYRTLDIRGDIAQGMWTDNIPNRRIGIMNNQLQVAGMEIENTSLGGNYSQKLHLLTHHYGSSTDRRFTIDEDGNVGIGTQTPVNKLSVQGDASITGLVSSNSISTGNIVTLPTGSITTNTIVSPNISSSKFKVTEVWNNVQGNPSLGNFTSGGGSLLLNISAMAYQNSGGPASLTIDVYMDGIVVATLKGFATQSATQIPLTTNFKVIVGMAAGNHNISIVPVAPTIVDTNSYISASILELPF